LRAERHLIQEGRDPRRTLGLGQAVIRGRVIAAADGSAVKDAMVSASGPAFDLTRTDSEGRVERPDGIETHRSIDLREGSHERIEPEAE
jgi:hypothetical protein